jgi:hypothetical protein
MVSPQDEELLAAVEAHVGPGRFADTSEDLYMAISASTAIAILMAKHGFGKDMIYKTLSLGLAGLAVQEEKPSTNPSKTATALKIAERIVKFVREEISSSL